MTDRAAEIAMLRAALMAKAPNLTALRKRFAGLLDWAALKKLKEETPAFSAARRLTASQRGGMIALALIVCCALALAPVRTLVAINATFVLYAASGVILRVWMMIIAIEARPGAAAIALPAQLPMVTILIPLYREADSLAGLVHALRELDYPTDKLDIKILLEADDLDTQKRARLLCRMDCFDIVIVPDSQPRTKPKACNYGLWTALGEIVVIYDAEDRPQPDQLRKAVSAFHTGGSDLACVQARLNYYNRRENWLTGLFAMEYALLFDIVLPALSRLGAPIPLGGTSNFFRTRILQDLSGWDPFNVTEDADLGLRLDAAGYRVGVIRSTTYEEAVCRPYAWIRQRSRWIKGYIQTWFVHTRRETRQRGTGSIGRAITLHLVLGGTIVSAIVNPVFWALYVVWLCGLGGWIETLFPPPVLQLSIVTLLAGNTFMAWLTLIAPLRRRWYDHSALVILMPVYWLMLSAAGYMALYQFIRKPFYWEKTTHAVSPAAQRHSPVTVSGEGS